MFVATVIVSAFLALAVVASAAGKLSRVPQVVDMLTGSGVPGAWRPRLAAATARSLPRLCSPCSRPRR